MDNLKTGLIAAGIVSILSVAVPAFAQSYSYSGNNYAYYPQQSAAYSNPMTYQVPTYARMPSYNTYPSYQRQNNYQYQNAQPNFYYTYPPVNRVQYIPSSYQNPVSYGPTHSYPGYDSYYAPSSNYYTTYPQQNMGYTGDRDALGTPLCNWQGYGRSDCSFNPNQPVYDAYTGTWY